MTAPDPQPTLAERTGDVTFASDFACGEFRVGGLSVGDRIALNGVKHTIVGGPINHDDGSITFYLSEMTDPCGGNTIGGSGCTCDPPF